MLGLGYQEMMAFGVIALMLFGSKLPEVARNFGASYRELRKHLDSFQREFQNWEHSEPTTKKPAFTPETERIEPTAPKFIPPPPSDDNE
jgi:sec-independent protein translocase protein TatA